MAANVDMLCITAHPDDAELAWAGTLFKHVAEGRSVGLVDLTSGELGTRGNEELRRQEAEAARKILGAAFRYQLGLPDGFIRKDRTSLVKVVTALRRHRPKIVLTNALEDRHPDHGRAADLVAEACFLSGLRKLVTEHDGLPQDAWRPQHLLHGIQDNWMEPQLVVDITPYWSKKQEVIGAFNSQFHDPANKEPETPISSLDFWDFLEGRARQFGRLIGTTYGEGFIPSRPVGVNDLMDLI